MKNLIKFKGYTIVRFVVALSRENGEIIGEYDNMAEARREHPKKSKALFLYGAAEIINDRGDVNPPVYGTTLKQATDKLKKIL